jgi:dimethylglycine dehydrogenase
VPAIAERQKQGAPELPIIRDPEESWYCRQERDGFILGPYEKQAQVWSPDGVPPDFGAELMAPDLDRVEHIIEAAMARVPALATAGVKTVVNGPITFTPDANPLIGPAHGLPNAWLLTGSSMGVMEGGGAGKFLAHWMTHGTPPMDALAVDSRRFGPWADRNYRIDKAIECFGLQFGVHYPFEERPAARNIRSSPLHDLMLERGAVMGAAHGAERPNWFSQKPHDETRDSFRRTNWFAAMAREVDAVMNRVALADLSVFSKFDVTGPDTLRFLDVLGANTPPRPGRIGLTHALTPAGGVASEFTVTVLAPDRAYLNSAAAAEEMDLDLLNARAAGFNVSIRNRTDDLAVIGLMGPRSGEALGALIGPEAVASISWLDAREIAIAGVPVRLLRVSYVGEKGYELHLDRAHAVQIFRALEDAGKSFGIGHYGAYAANSMRLEKGYRGWGMDLTTERTPLETGLAFLVKPDDRDFIGRDAMLKRQPGWDMVLLEIDTDGEVEPFYSHTVFGKGRPVGVVTSGAFGHRVRKSLALAFLRERDMREGLTVKLLGRERPARVLDAPPYDPQNLKLKA